MNTRNLAVYAGGILFGFGLAYSGMTQPEIVLSFLRLDDLGLIFVMGGAAVITFFAVNAVPKFMKAPVLGGTIKPRVSVLTKNTIIGAAIFGIGWGDGGGGASPQGSRRKAPAGSRAGRALYGVLTGFARIRTSLGTRGTSKKSLTAAMLDDAQA